MDYHTIKHLAEEVEGVTIRDLIALAPQNDPFYVGTPGDIAKAQWFADIWRKFGYSHGVHLRRVHYQLVSQSPPINKPNGKPYENTEKDWDYLGMASKSARYLGTVEPDAFVDRRNPDPHIYTQHQYDPTPRYNLAEWKGLQVDLPQFPDVPSFTVAGYDGGDLQPFHLEIWCEKSTMNDVLTPLCEKYSVNLVTGAGEMSITSALEVVRRIQEANRPARILYISDFDPAGYGMPVSVSRKLEFFLTDRGLDLDIQLEPIALDKEQVDEYDLPRTPIKQSELRRQSFIAAHGAGAVELDALEALHPGLLAEITQRAILRYYDTDIDKSARAQRWNLKWALEEAREAALEPFAVEVEELEVIFRQAVREFEERISDVQQRLGELHPQIKNALSQVDIDIDDYPLPDPKPAEEFEQPLYSSERDYLEQLKQYKMHQNGGD
ncbi:MAG: hypothetical protein DRP09_20190 [Candidatus Thorarchaeota archaeon]|nr:MAG: hypothetical protein DRP09_20190 [Candidatus Thorarchaeota archaeon]